MAERPQSLLDRAMVAGFKILVIAWILNLALRLVEKVTVPLIIITILVLIGISVITYYRSRW